MILRAMMPEDVHFVHECLRELRGTAEYRVGQLATYLSLEVLLRNGSCTVLVGEVDGNRVGMLTCNRYAMPRYLGHGIELEEVVVHPTHQGRGHATAMLEVFLGEAIADPGLRRITVRTDDLDRAGRLYSKYFETSATTVYAKAINRL